MEEKDLIQNIDTIANSKNSTSPTSLDFFATSISGSFDLSNRDDLEYLTNEELSLKDKDYYKNNDKVKALFTDEKGVFDDKKFDKTYDSILESYNYLSEAKTAINLISAEYLDSDLFSTGESFYDNIKESPLTSKVRTIPNYSKITLGLAGLDVLTDPKISAREAAQTNVYFDTKKQKFVEETPDDYSLFRNPLGMFTKQFVLDTYKEDIKDDAGNVIHPKGSLKFYNDKPYYRTIEEGEDILDQQVLSFTDRLTPEGSLLNKYDFFDSDDVKKTTAGVLTKTALNVIPYVIPGVNVAYTSAIVGRELLNAGSELIRSFGNLLDDDFTESELNKNLHTLQNVIKQTKSSSSDYTQANGFSLENVLNMGVAVVDQLYGIRGISKIPKYITALNQQGFVKATTGLSRNLAGMKGSLDTVKQGSKIGSLASNAMSNVYFAGTASVEMAEQSRALGLDPVHSSLLHLGTMAAFSALYKFGPFDWMTKEFGLDDVGKSVASKLKESVIPNLSLYKNLSPTEKTSKALLANAKGLKEVFKGLVASGGTTVLTSASSEAVEEMTEEAIQDGIKYFYNQLTDAGLIKKKGKKFTFDNTAERYITSGLGGALGGGLFKTIPKLESLMFGKMADDPIGKDINWLLTNGYEHVVQEELERMYKKGFVDKSLSTEYTVNDAGERIYKTTSKKEDTANYKIYNAVKSMLDTQMNILSSTIPSNELAEQYTDAYGRIVDAKTETFLRDDHNNLTDQLVSIEASIKDNDAKLLTSGVDKEVIIKQGDDLRNKRKALQDELEFLYKGGKSPDYLLQGLYILRPDILEKAGLRTVNSIADEKFSLPFDFLNPDQKKIVRNTFIQKVREGSESGYKQELRESIEKVLANEKEVFIPKLKSYTFDYQMTNYLKKGLFDSVFKAKIDFDKINDEEFNTKLTEKLAKEGITEKVIESLNDTEKFILLQSTDSLNLSDLEAKITANKISDIAPEVLEFWDKSDINPFNFLSDENYSIAAAKPSLYSLTVANPEALAAYAKFNVGELTADDLKELYDKDLVNFDDLVNYRNDVALKNNTIEGFDVDFTDIDILKIVETDTENIKKATDLLDRKKREKYFNEKAKFTLLKEGKKQFREKSLDYLLDDIEQEIARQEEMAKAEPTSYIDDNSRLDSLLKELNLYWANLEAHSSVNPEFVKTMFSPTMAKFSSLMDKTKFQQVYANNIGIADNITFPITETRPVIEALGNRLQSLYQQSELNKRNYINNINKYNAVNFKIQHDLFKKLAAAHPEFDIDFSKVVLLNQISVSKGNEKLFISDVEERRKLYNEIVDLYDQVYTKYKDLSDEVKTSIKETIAGKDLGNIVLSADGELKVDLLTQSANTYLTEYHPNFALQFFGAITAVNAKEFYGKVKSLLDNDNVLAPVYTQEYNLLNAYAYLNGELDESILDRKEQIIEEMLPDINGKFTKIKGMFVKAPAGAGKTEIFKNLIMMSNGTSLVSTQAGTPLITLSNRLDKLSDKLYGKKVLEFNDLLTTIGFTKEQLETIANLPKITAIKAVGTTSEGSATLDSIIDEVKDRYLEFVKDNNITQILIDEAQWLHGNYVMALSRLAAATNTKAPVYFGDVNQLGFIDNGGAYNISSTVMFDTPDVDSVLRTGVTEVKDIQKKLRKNGKEAIKEQSIGDYKGSYETGIRTYFDKESIMGTYVTSNQGDDVFDKLLTKDRTIAIYTNTPLSGSLLDLSHQNNVDVYSDEKNIQSAEYDTLIIVDDKKGLFSANNDEKKRQYEKLYTLSTRAKKNLIFVTDNNTLFESSTITTIPDIIPDLSEISKLIKSNKVIELSDIEAVEITSKPSTGSVNSTKAEDIESNLGKVLTSEEGLTAVITDKGLVLTDEDFTNGAVRMYTWFLPNYVVESGKYSANPKTKEELRQIQYYLLTKDPNYKLPSNANKQALDNAEYVFTVQKTIDKTKHVDLGTNQDDTLTDGEPLIALSAKIKSGDSYYYTPISVFPNHEKYKEEMAAMLGLDSIEKLDAFIDILRDKVSTLSNTSVETIELTIPKSNPWDALGISKNNYQFSIGRKYFKKEANRKYENASTIEEFKKKHDEILFSNTYILNKNLTVEGFTLKAGTPYMFYSYNKDNNTQAILSDPELIVNELLKGVKSVIGFIKLDRRRVTGKERIEEIINLFANNSKAEIEAVFDMFISKEASERDTEDSTVFSNALSTYITSKKAKFKEFIEKFNKDSGKTKYLSDKLAELDEVTTGDVDKGKLLVFISKLTKGPDTDKAVRITALTTLFKDFKLDKNATQGVNVRYKKQGSIKNLIIPTQNDQDTRLVNLDYISRPSIDVKSSTIFSNLNDNMQEAFKGVKPIAPQPTPSPDNTGGQASKVVNSSTIIDNNKNPDTGEQNDEDDVDDSTEGETFGNTSPQVVDLKGKTTEEIFDSYLPDENKREALLNAMRFVNRKLVNSIIFDPKTGSVLKKTLKDC